MRPKPKTVYDKNQGVYLLITIFGYIIYLYVKDELKNYHIYIGSGVIIFLIFNKIYLYFKGKKNQELDSKRKVEFDKYKASLDNVIVDLAEIEIINNDWTEEKTITHHVGDNYYEETIEEYLNLNRLKITIPYKGREINYVSHSFYMDKKELEIKLALQKTAVLYINSDNIKEHFLDLDFLDIKETFYNISNR